ncbi:carbohydrate ABC transporter permease [Inconstantimicrobium mannanitabidum]|uniref:Uncharacterized protein n=1 Tax=Inconstantimicrobium mannanitabidum TaxID=1604901 RepID=A0ACB5RDA2_9CLOT|nr:sugar ABC transporter permease [Clostridium sp. TW13]GKX67252.1 hypothetical protein rsdtw13_25100 [Clostridium sp. TW13]
MKTSKMDKARPYLYVSPLMISIFILSFLPIVYTIYISFTNYNINHVNDYSFIGFENYKSILTGDLQPIFLPVFIWTVIFAIGSAVGTYLIGLIFAMILSNENMKERGVYKALLILPWAVPGLISMMIWQGMFNAEYGAINMILMKFHIINTKIPWLLDPTWAKVAVFVLNFWLGFPWMMNICLGALSAVDKSYYEAAEIDGATRWQKFRNITLPSITASSLPLVISSFAMNFNNFMVPYMLNEGGPAKIGVQYAGATDLLGGAAYKLTVSTNRYDWSATLSVLIFLVVGTLSIIQMKKTGAFEEVE